MYDQDEGELLCVYTKKLYQHNVSSIRKHEPPSSLRCKLMLASDLKTSNC